MAGIDLGLLPPLSAVKQMTHEEIQAEMVSIGKLDEMTPSDPGFRPMLAGSYRETLLRQDADEQVRAVMLATARGSDLDHIGVTYYRGVDGKPILRLAGESDDDYRYRLHNSPAGLSTAGPKGAYEFHATSAHPNIKQALAVSPADVCVLVYVLGRSGSGEVSKSQCDLVDGYLWARRPLTDKVDVESAEIVTFSISATIKQAINPDPSAVTERARQSLAAYVALQHRLKGKITLSAIHAALTVPGVDEVIVDGWSDVVCEQHQAPFCDALAVEFAGWSE